MALTNLLLKDIFFGTELEKLDISLSKMKDIFYSHLGYEFDVKKSEEILGIIKDFFRIKHVGRYGGCITAGDALFIGAFMKIIKPSRFLEIGVCSGVSSSSILYCADRLNLLTDSSAFLESFDITDCFEGKRVGRVVEKSFSDLQSNWDLKTNHTSKYLFENRNIYASKLKSEKVMAFVDAEHRHPWPLLDTIVLLDILPHGSWILLQDTCLTERWLSNSLERGVPCPEPCRGVQLVLNLWPGKKVIGTHSMYNMAALRTGISKSETINFITQLLCYESEFNKVDEIVQLQPFITQILRNLKG